MYGVFHDRRSTGKPLNRARRNISHEWMLNIPTLTKKSLSLKFCHILWKSQSFWWWFILRFSCNFKKRFENNRNTAFPAISTTGGFYFMSLWALFNVLRLIFRCGTPCIEIIYTLYSYLMNSINWQNVVWSLLGNDGAPFSATISHRSARHSTIRRCETRTIVTWRHVTTRYITLYGVT